MNEHLSIGDLERIRFNEEASDHSDERSLATIQAHLQSCPECQARLDELTDLDRLADHVHAFSQSEPPLDTTLSIPGYELDGEIHRGGQGIVYAAIQKSTGRRVAIKVLLSGSFATDRQRHRFEQEIDLAARISHPNVVSIIDRGTTADHRGFLVMELVDGLTLDRYITEHTLITEDRLRLFLQICDGVQAAHQRGVLHRDLKPGNIIIDQGGQAKILDFGLAKGDDADQLTTARTIAGEFMGTLAYASPEQLSGEPESIDSRTDVYSLGVLLFELLTGTLPHAMDGRVDSVIKRVLEAPPKRPSSVRSRLDADLDVIVLHALEKEPERRYTSVDAFASDVRAVLQNQPIHARRSSTVYQLRKFARRHRVGVSLSLVMMLGLVGTISGLGVGLARASAANKLAEDRRVAAEIELDKQGRVSTFFNDLLARVDPGLSGPDMRVIELLDVASKEVDARFAQYPDLRGNLQLVLGETHTRLGSYEEAESQLMDSIRSLRTVDPLPHRALAIAYIVLAQTQTATTRLDDAELSLDEAEELLAGLDEHDMMLELRSQLEHQRGALLYEHGDFESSIASYKRSIESLGNIESDERKRIASQALIGLGVSLKRLEQFELALASYDRALVYLRDVRSENHPDTLACLQNRAEILNNLGRSAEAEEQLVDLLERRRLVFGETHERVGITLNNLADLLSARGAYAQAAEYFNEALTIFRLNPGDPSLRLAITIHNAGVMHLDQGVIELATPHLLEAWEMSSGLLPEGHWIAAQFGTKYAECLITMGNYEAAVDILGTTYPALVASLGEEHRRSEHARSLLENAETKTEE